MTNQSQVQADNAYYLDVLHTLIDQGASLARQIHERAVAANATPWRPEADPTIAFDRIARCIRRTIALAQHIAADPAPTQAPIQTAAPPEPAPYTIEGAPPPETRH